MKDKFPRLFLLSSQQDASIRDMGLWTNGMWHWRLQWRRLLLDREIQVLESLLALLDLVTLTRDRPDKWFWEPEIDGLYSVKSAYKLIQGPEEEESIPVFKLLWQNIAPSNVKAFGWRALWGRIQTKENLMRRGIIQTEEAMACPFCINAAETMEHVLFTCPFAMKVWNAYNSWFGVSTTLPENCRMHLLQHGQQLWSNRQRVGSQTIWLAIIWTLWLHRNRVIFREGVKDAERVFDLAQMRAWNWLKARYKRFRYSLYEWVTNPVYCLQIL